MTTTEVLAVKDEENALPVASAWRPAFKEVVRLFAHGDYTLSTGVDLVRPMSDRAVKQIRNYLASYGETLAELPDETWKTSLSQWMETQWDVLVDLWTVESGKSDMVLSARVFETGDSFSIEVESIHVP